MKFSCCEIENVTAVKMVSACCTMGVGLITVIARSFCSCFGLQCKMYDAKIEKAKNLAATELLMKAKSLNADGIMNVTIQIHDTTIFMYGMAYIENK